MKNYLNFEDDVEIERPVYRIFSVARLLSIFNNRRLVLVRPKKWDDPFENFILRARASLAYDDSQGLDLTNNVYGQCWSQHPETDAMWRIYSQNKDGVKISSTPEKLLNALNRSVEGTSGNGYVGKVKYHSQKSLANLIEVAHLSSNYLYTERDMAESLLFKRFEFRHEKEVRLIYCEKEGASQSDLYSFEVNPFNLITSIVFDPRMEKDLASVYMQYIRGIGFDGSVSQSTLYEIPQLNKRISQMTPA